MNFFIVIYGPTASGKTDYALELARDLPVEIINADVGQFYTPLTIGTAKPDWRQQETPHHLFDVVNEPVDYSAFQYQRTCSTLMQDIMKRGNIPLIVGGSGFYIKSLFFPQKFPNKLSQPVCIKTGQEKLSLWQTLHAIDPVRAEKVHPHDTYRLERAITLWHTTGILPSQLEPELSVPAECLFLFLDRDKAELNDRINKRVELMLGQGWIDEVCALYEKNPLWEGFLERKGLMGYSDIGHYVKAASSHHQNNHHKNNHYENLVATIQQKTREYARRQRIFWRSLQKQLEQSELITCENIFYGSTSKKLLEYKAIITKNGN